jgi:DNA-binding transcriptional regulator YhcF (GntR family)
MDTEVKQLKKMAEDGLVTTYKKKTYFVMAENTFIKNPKYTITQKMVYLCLQTYAGAVDSCYPSKESIAKNLSVTPKTVYTVLKQLEDIGAIIIINQITETNRKTSNLYILCDIDKDNGDFVPKSIEKFKILSKEPIRINGK